SSRLVSDGPVAELKRGVEYLVALLELCLGDAKRRVGHDRVPAHEGVHPTVEQRLGDGLHLRRRAVERSEGLERLAVANQLETTEQAYRPRRADAWMPLAQPAMDSRQHLAHAPRVADHIVLFVRLERAERRGAAEGMAVVGQPAVEGVVVEVRRDRGSHPHRAEWHVARGQALG